MSPKEAHRYKSQEKPADATRLPITPYERVNRYAPDTRRAATTTKASRKSSIFSSGLTNSNRNKYPSSPDWDSQITLTQLVPRAETSNDVSELLDYEDNGNETSSKIKHVEVIDLIDDNENENDEVAGRSYNRHTFSGRPRSTGFRSSHDIPPTTFKRRKSSNGVNGGIRTFLKPSTKSHVKRLGLKGKDGNKTLTQMDFVRRYIPLPESDDDDLTLYDEPVPAIKGVDISKIEDIDDNTHDNVTPRKRRRLNDSVSLLSPTVQHKSSPDQKQARLPQNLTSDPRTPQRIQHLDSPSSDMRKWVHMSGESPPSLQTKKDHSDSKCEATVNESPPSKVLEAPANEIPASPTKSIPSFPQSSTDDKVTLPTSNAIRAAIQRSVPPPSSSRYKAIIYDTEDDTDHSESDDDSLPQAALPNGAEMLEAWVESKNNHDKDDDTQDCDNSDDLPPIANSGTDLEIGANNHSDPALASEASIYYHRPARYTQYPNGPVPPMNTQKIAELFPMEGENEPLSASNTSVPSTIDCTASSGQHPTEVFCGETATATPTQEEVANRSIQMVPESSPISRSYEVRPTPNSMAPPSRESIVLVESSQLVDRISRQNDSVNTGISLKRLFSTGEFLTDSVMDSIPPPPWMLSQDSIGEPYPEKTSHRRGT